MTIVKIGKRNIAAMEDRQIHLKDGMTETDRKRPAAGKKLDIKGKRTFMTWADDR